MAEICIHFRNHLDSALISNPSPLDFFENETQARNSNSNNFTTTQYDSNILGILIWYLMCWGMIIKILLCFNSNKKIWCVQWNHIKHWCCVVWCTCNVKCSCSMFRTTRKLCPVTQTCAFRITVDWLRIWFCSNFCSLHTRNCMQIYVHVSEGWRLMSGRHLPQFSTRPFKI